MDFESLLNDKQYAAVSSPCQHLRVVAGAGSGKTRVLTYRIAYLISELNVSPWEILAITFTNKVAGEMKKRVVNMLPQCEKLLTIRTFHSFAAYFLRHEIHLLDFPASFTIYDEEDQETLVKNICKEMGYTGKDKIVKQSIAYIGSKKLQGLYPDDINIVKPLFENERECLEIYHRYEEQKERCLSLDFDDLLLKTNYILENYPLVREQWRQRYQHILVDEFQDTNDIEYKLIRLLKSPSCSLYVVGDPDQTIYTWRGANQDIILKMERDFPDVETIYLEQNYRSTQNILNSANKLIKNNKMRLEKNLFTITRGGEPVRVVASPSGKGEARYVASEIKRLVEKENYLYSDIVLLYRSNFVTLDFEGALMNAQIPYRIYGGQKFFQRKEIKDVLAYFKLIINPNDDVSFKRIINVPPRKIGEVSASSIEKAAVEKELSIYDYIKNVEFDDCRISQISLANLKSMIQLLESTKEKLNEKDGELLSKKLEDMIISIGYYEYLKKDEDSGEDRIENVKELFNQIRHFLVENPDLTLEEYLQNVALYSAQDDIEDGDFVTLMTAHTAKGLEFPVVFVVRFNDGVFPNNRALIEGGFKALEEERRLAYVALTRAEQRLYLTCSFDYSYTVGGNLLPSQFYNESGNPIAVQSQRPVYNQPKPKQGYGGVSFDDYNKKLKEEYNKQQSAKPTTNNVTSWSVGDVVLHTKFGRGVVVALEGEGIIVVDFEEFGRKSMLSSHPTLKKGEK